MSRDKVERVTNRALQTASMNDHEYLMSEHILSSLLQEDEIQQLVEKVGGNYRKLKSDIDNYISNTKHIPKSKNATKRTVSIERIYNRAYTQSVLSGKASIDIQDILSSILCEEKTYSHYYLNKNGVTFEKVVEEITKQKHGLNDAEALIGKYCKNLNEQCQEGLIDPIIGREDEVQNLVEVLARRRKNNAVLVGPAGVGKTAIAEGLAMRIVRKEIQHQFHDKIVYSLDIGSIMAGTKYRGDLEERIKLVLDYLAKQENTILFIDEIHMIIGAGAASQSNVDIANLLKPMLAKGQLRCVGATTNEEFTTHFEKDPALMRRFKRIDIEEPSLENSKRILHGLRKYYEDFHKVSYTDESLNSAVDLSRRYIKGKYLPDKAIDLIDAAGSRAKLAGAVTVDCKAIKEHVSCIGRIQADDVDMDEALVYENLADRIKKQIYGQNKAVDNVVESVLISRSGLREENKPVGSFLFIGPTGVGKAQPLSSRIKVPGGWTTMGDVEVGRTISTPNGKDGKVIGTFPQGRKVIYEVVFEDGRTARSCIEHLWRIYSDNQYKTVDLGEVRNMLEKGDELYVDLITPEKTAKKDLPIAPYTMGVLLSTGSFYSGGVTIAGVSEESITRVMKELPADYVPIVKEGYAYRISNTLKNDNSYVKDLKGLGMLDKKPWSVDIPDVYMSASYEQKVELLKGIFDNIGWSKHGMIVVNSVSDYLLRSIRDLIWSIGGWANLRSVNLLIKLKDAESLFAMKTSIENEGIIRNRISEIRLCNEEEAKCILLDDDAHLYITDDYVITHNTELCRELAKNLGVKLVKLDMSEYSEKHTVSKLIGSPPGYVGHGQGSTGQGQLITLMEENPNCVLLLDEIEKAAPEVFQLLLQVMDDAKLSSSSGKKTVDFSNAIVIMTSNLGAQESEKQSIGFTNNIREDSDTKAMTEFFTPEFRNRLDGIIRFGKLSIDEMLLIVDKMLSELNDLAEKSKVSIKCSREAKNWLAHKGHDPLMGARPLKRVINDEIKKPLSREILFGQLAKVGGKVLIRVVDDELEIEYLRNNDEEEFEIPMLEEINTENI